MGDSGFPTGTGRSTRRQFGRAVAGAAVGAFAAPAIVRGRNLNEKLNIAMIGVARRGEHNMKQFRGENIAAICDVLEPALDRPRRPTPRRSDTATSARCTITRTTSTPWS